MPFEDRVDAGRRLAERLEHLRGRDVVVLGLPRGGVPVAFEVARALGAPLDVIVVRKLGVPFQPELAMGAIAPGGVMVLNHEVLKMLPVSREDLLRVATQEKQELERRSQVYRGDRPMPQIYDRTIILVDDGIATSSTIRAAIALLQRQQPKSSRRHLRRRLRRRPSRPQVCEHQPGLRGEDQAAQGDGAR